LPDLDTEIRPALIRIGARIARLVVALPRGVDPVRVRTLTRDALIMRALDAEHVDRIASALAALTASDANAGAKTAAQ